MDIQIRYKLYLTSPRTSFRGPVKLYFQKTETDPGGWMGWPATHYEWPCNYSDMQIKALHY